MLLMARIAVTRRISLPHDTVWDALADLGSHHVWMRDARSIVFVTDQRSGEGTRMRVKTVVGPFRTLDDMEVVGWDEGRSIEVAHIGLVKGRGTFTLTDGAPGETLVTWDEELRFPWWLGGPVTAMLARPVLTRIWRSNLRRLEESLSSP
jgi:uncharacterized protein YndB with AHSA1/START domain